MKQTLHCDSSALFSLPPSSIRPGVNKESVLVSVMIATLRFMELVLIFTAYFLKHREISEDLFNLKFNLQTIHTEIPGVSFVSEY